MKETKLTFNESQLADILRSEIMKTSENIAKPIPKKSIFSKIEYISTSTKNEQENLTSKILSMNEDQVLSFVERLEVNDLKALTDIELNYIGGVLGVNPKTLVEGRD